MGHQFAMLGDELVSTVIDYYRDYYRLAKNLCANLTLSATRDKSWHLLIVVSILSYCTRAVIRFLYIRFLFSLLLGLNLRKFSRFRTRVAAILRNTLVGIRCASGLR